MDAGFNPPRNKLNTFDTNLEHQFEELNDSSAITQNQKNRNPYLKN